MNAVGFLTTVLHDVDFTAVGPTDRFEIVAQEPERRPDALPHREANTRLESPARMREQPPRVDAARGVGRTLVRFPVGCDGKMAVAVQSDVLGAGCVELELRIPPIGSYVEIPLGRILS